MKAGKPRRSTVAAGLAAIFLMTFVGLEPLQAQRGAPRKLSPKQSEQVREGWQRRMQKINQQIHEGRSDRALRQANRLAAEMVERILSGDGTAQLLGMVNVLRALAAVNLGLESLALWHWHIGLQMFPEVAEFDFSDYGEAGKFLVDHPLSSPSGESGDSAEDRTEKSSEIKEKITPPRKKKAPSAKVPAAKLGRMQEPVSVVVQAIIDKEGQPTRPRIVEANGEFTLVCAALESLWQWEFEPATIDGEPVEVYYNLTVNFRSGWR